MKRTKRTTITFIPYVLVQYSPFQTYFRYIVARPFSFFSRPRRALGAQRLKLKVEREKLATCVDVPAWKDNTDWGCSDYEAYEQCGGAEHWNYDEPISYYTNFLGFSAEEACCACGGGTIKDSPADATKTNATTEEFDDLASKIKAAPTNGKVTTIAVDVPTISWGEEVVLRQDKILF